MDNPPVRSVDTTVVRDSMTRRLHRRSIVNGQLALPAAPGMIDEYRSLCETLFTGVGRPFTSEQLDRLIHLVFNAFLAKPGYVPDEGARELGQHCYTTIFTAQELYAAASGLPLQLVSDDSVYDYEMTHLPAGVWPPTSGYADWVSGRDVFDLPRDECPIEMRWLVYQKPAW